MASSGQQRRLANLQLSTAFGGRTATTRMHNVERMSEMHRRPMQSVWRV